tara:strand:+ start:504 stop:812 length:309 start_codon:yes stop_codon:yes gene_type:complete
MTQYAISQHEENISLNAREYVLESDHPRAEVKLFDSVSDAMAWLLKETSWEEETPTSPLDLEDYGIFIEPYEWPDDDDEEPRVPWLTKGELWALEQKDKKDD